MTATTPPSRIELSPVGSMNYHMLRELIDEFDILQLQHGAEIGVLYADTSTYLLSSFPQLALLSVDPYLPYEEIEKERTESSMSTYEALAHERLAAFGPRASLVKATSLEAVEAVPNEYFDFVFIDALHTYEAVRNDIAAWTSKIRPGGLLSGHDISWGGVKQAVEEYAAARQVKIYQTPLLSDIWYTFITPDGTPTNAPRSQASRRAGLEILAKKYGVPIEGLDK